MNTSGLKSAADTEQPSHHPPAMPHSDERKPPAKTQKPPKPRKVEKRQRGRKG